MPATAQEPVAPETDPACELDARYESARVQARFEEIASADGIVVVHFVKRTNGMPRRMQCLYDDRAALRARFSYDVVSRDLMPCWDVEKGAIRMISLDAVERIISGGEVVYDRDDHRHDDDIRETDTGLKMDLY